MVSKNDIDIDNGMKMTYKTKWYLKFVYSNEDLLNS